MYKFLFSIFNILSVTLLFGQTAAELNQKSKIFLSKGDVKTALPLIKQAADSGNAEAQYNLGYCYQEGYEVPKSDSIAGFWLLKSASQGWKDAQFKMAYCYFTGRGVKQDSGLAFYWALKCANQNDPECMSNVVDCYKTGTGIAVNVDSMLKWAIRLSLLENPEDLQLSGKITSARLSLAIMYRDGDKLPKDLLKSYTWFLIYNESKRDFSILVQQEEIDAIKEVEKHLKPIEKLQAKSDAEMLTNRKLANFENLYKQDL